MREVRFKVGFECPHCTSEHINRFGKVNGRQRYRCKARRKTFMDTTNTILYRTRKGNEWITFVECMFKGYITLGTNSKYNRFHNIEVYYW